MNQPNNMSSTEENDFVFHDPHPRCDRLWQAYRQFVHKTMGANKLDQVEYLAIQQADGAFLNQICNGDTGRIEPQECPQHGASCLEKEDGSPEYATLTVADLKERGKNFYEDYQTFVKRFAKSQSLDAKEQCTLNEFGLTHMAQIYDKDKDRFEVQGEDADKYNKMLELQAKYLSSIIFETDTVKNK